MNWLRNEICEKIEVAAEQTIIADMKNGMSLGDAIKKQKGKLDEHIKNGINADIQEIVNRASSTAKYLFDLENNKKANHMGEYYISSLFYKQGILTVDIKKANDDDWEEEVKMSADDFMKFGGGCG